MLGFEKYHGCGNDFIIVDESDIGGVARGGSSSGADAFDVLRGSAGSRNPYGKIDGLLDDCTLANADDLRELARKICHRQLGVGADGLIIVRRNPLTMEIINSDGSVAPMCGNGIRCFALYAVNHGLVPGGACGAENFPLPQAACEFDVDTLAGVMRVRVSTEGDSFTAEINMGCPDFSARAAGMDEDGEFMKREVALDSGIAGMPVSAVKLSSLFLGTYHTVVWLDENELVTDSNSLYVDPNIDIVGRAIESHPVFTQRTNVNFARVVDRNTVEMITWERGAGLTAACGTGASSVVALGIREGRLGEGAACGERKFSASDPTCGEGNISVPQDEVRVILPYGELFIRQAENGDVFMRGPAEHVFDGEYNNE